jgi:hypothetical protein
MDYLEKGSPVRQNIRQDVYNSTNFVGRVDAQSLESKSISTESLDIDFTDTLSYVTSDSLTQDIGKQFIGGVGWIPVEATGDAMVSEFEDDDSLIRNGLFDLDFDSGMGILPFQSVGDYFELKSGTYSGSVISNVIEKTPFGDFINTRRLFIQDGSDNRSYDISTSLTSTGEGIYIAKTNESGEIVAIGTDAGTTGFAIRNDLSDNTASVLRIEDNNGDAILEFFNDYLVSDTIPSLDYADDAAAATGGVPVGGIYHNSGTIRIRLT